VSDSSVALSLVIPAYNEAHRLPPYLASVRAHLQFCYGDRCEVIVVDDGSSDGLMEFLADQKAGWAQLRVLRHEHNQGKGAAVRTGVLASRGELVLFADADGATPIAEEPKLADAIRAGADLAIGSRLLTAPGVRRVRSPARGLAGRVFAAIATRWLNIRACDTQCGFKMFRGQPARRIFSLVREPHYLFDLEVLALAQRLGYRLAEVPIQWQEIPGGHLRLVGDLPWILRDLWRLRWQIQGRVVSAEQLEGRWETAREGVSPHEQVLRWDQSEPAAKPASVGSGLAPANGRAEKANQP
jgi:dolichyl-phosphate beta-glucosyltransferase